MNLKYFFSALPTIQDEAEVLAKSSCHDSGIDIREPIAVVSQVPAKKIYSDADIVLSTDWVPPVTIVPTNVSAGQPEESSSLTGRKKTSSVSFSLDSNNEGDSAVQSASTATTKEEQEKHETKKNKVVLFCKMYIDTTNILLDICRC